MPSQSPVSNRAISDQVTKLANAVSKLATEAQKLKDGQAQLRLGQSELRQRVDGLNLNGSAPALIALAVAAPSLLKLADAAPRLIEVADKQADLDGFWRVMRRFLNPFRPVGAVLWLVVTSLVAAYTFHLFNL